MKKLGKVGTTMRRSITAVVVSALFVTALLPVNVNAWEYRYQTQVKDVGVHSGGQHFLTPEQYGGASCAYGHIYRQDIDGVGRDAGAALSIALASKLSGKGIEIAFDRVKEGDNVICRLRLIRLMD